MGSGRRKVIWSVQAASALNEAVGYVSADSPSAGIQLLEAALEAGSRLAELSERGRVVPEVGSPTVRELFVFKYRLMYEIANQEVHVIAFVHGARDFVQWQAGKVEDPD